MATVKMHQIKATLGRSISYITREAATLGGTYVSTTAAVIDPSDARAITRQFEATQAQAVRAARADAVLAHHIIQSFDPSEKVSPQLAHEIGVKLAAKIGAGRFEVVVATHDDKRHVHNHIIVNAVSYEDGKRMRVEKDTIYRFREWSDRLCVDHGLKVLPAPERRPELRSPSIGQVYARARGASKVDAIKVGIDRAIAEAKTWPQFEAQLREQGIEVGVSQRKNITFKTPDMGRSVRDIRLGAGYREVDLMARLGRSSVMRFDVDRSLVVGNNEGTIRLRLPGTGGQRTIAVNADQVVQHGRTMRVHLPAEGTQAIMDRHGRIQANVPTVALYAAFVPPERELIRTHGERVGADKVRGSRALREALEGMHEAESELNARARLGSTESQTVIRQAVAVNSALDEAVREVQTLAIAVDDAAKGSQRQRDLSVALSDAINHANELQEEAKTLVKLAEDITKGSAKKIAEQTLTERLAAVEDTDVAAVLGVEPDAPRVAQVTREVIREERPPQWSRMTLRERTEWIRQKNERTQQRDRERRRRDDDARKRRTR